MSVLKVHLTYQCSAECNHCRFSCTRKPGSAIDYDLVLQTVKDLKETNSLELVVLMGGEPGLYPELTHRLAEVISRMGLRVRIETNAFWATSEERAHYFLKPLFTTGASVMYSLDSFHESFIPIENIENAIRVSDRLDGKYSLEIEYIQSPESNYHEDARTVRLLSNLEKRIGRSPLCEMYQGKILYTGRAADKLAGKVCQEQGIPKQICGKVPWWNNGNLDTLDLLILDPKGYLSKGCGILIENVKNINTKDFIKGYDVNKHPIFKTLITSGPFGLAKEAEKLGYTIKEDYADKCHLCYEVRQVLKDKYPQYLLLIPEDYR